MRRIALMLLTMLGAPSAFGLTLEITGNRADANSVQVADLELTQDGVPVAWGGASITADGTSPSNEGPSNLLDDNASSKWLQFGSGSDIHATLTITGAPGFNGFRFRTGNDFPARDPVSFTLKDGSTVLFSVTNAAVPTERGVWTPVFAVSATPVVPPKPLVACLPDVPADFWNTAYKIGDVPSIVSTRYTKYVVWKGKDSCGGKVQGQLYSLADSAQFLANSFKSDAEINAWTASQPVELSTAAETRFLGQMIDAYKQVVTPAPQVTVTYRTTAQSSTDPTRQVYKANASGTGIGSAITGVRVMQGTPCGPKLGTTNYCSVAGQKDAQGRVIASGYAIGTAVQ